MVSSHTIPWYDRPARPFPIKLWQMQRFGFHVTLPTPAQARRAPARRPFPAKLWAEGRICNVSSTAGNDPRICAAVRSEGKSRVVLFP